MRRWAILLSILALAAAWASWTELDPQGERSLRIAVQERLDAWFPEQMASPNGARGFVDDNQALESGIQTEVVLVHGVDEPGGIWEQLKLRLDAEGIDHVEFRYPNDQAIDASADELARHWPKLDSSKPVALIGHSMGGLVIRDFITRHRQPADPHAWVAGPAVLGAILIGAPNHGSEWARLRAWLELREYAADLPAGRFSLFAALRDGTGAAKIDLRPGSKYLQQLNARPWPENVPIRIIGGRLAGPTPAMEENLAALSTELGLPELAETIGKLWAQTGESIGDGAVPVSSLALRGAPEPLVLEASHRGLIASMPFSDRAPPAIEPTIEILMDWRD